MLKFLFKDNFIQTWDDDLKIDDEYVPRWPPNSPDLSPIKIILVIIKQMLVFFPTKDINILKKSHKINMGFNS